MDDLYDGEIQLAHGIVISPILNEHEDLLAITFSHPIRGKPWEPDTYCRKVLPVFQDYLTDDEARKRFGIGDDGIARSGFWKRPGTTTQWAIGRSGPELNLWPSVACWEHNLHGFIRYGRWMTYRDWLIELWGPEKLERKLAIAREEVEEMDGDYMMALASRIFVSDYRPPAKPPAKPPANKYRKYKRRRK